MSRYKITCCMGCTDRHPGCHGSCDEYKQQKAEYDETKAEKDKRKAIEAGLDSCLYSSVHRIARRTNYRENNRKVK